MTGSAKALDQVAPRATYRLQFHRGFGFAAAAALAPYLGRLGVSHVYASPYLKARPGSTHGYDIVDHLALNPELGDAGAFAAMTAAFRANGLRQILDFVPNHMGVGGADNPLWLDVLEWGPESQHAGWFDIDWQPDNRYLRDKLLVPFLGDQYGVELQAGKLRLKYDADAGSFAVWAYEAHKLPVCPLHYDLILGDEHPELERLGDAFSDLESWRPQIGRRSDALKKELAALAKSDPSVAQAIEARLASLNGEPGDARSWERLHALIGRQHWRVAHFRVAGDDINYRRFFNINDLAGLRMELPDVFDHAHGLVLRLLGNGTLDGLRIDHIDGLLNPKEYLDRLRQRAGSGFYLVVEKILAAHEELRADWPVQGTTGYEFTNLVLGLLVDPTHEAAFTATYAGFTGLSTPYEEVVRAAKRRIMENEMASELNVLARDAARIARETPNTTDFTRNILQRALKEVIACFPVYRNYVDEAATPTEADRRDLAWAMSRARRNADVLDPSVFDFIERLLTGEFAAPRSGFRRHVVVRFAMRLQQYSGPVMAKGLEDTAFYRFNRFVALNEVGGEPERFGLSLASFHRANLMRREHWPHAMLATATHDTKRGEDTRARLAALAELPEEWAKGVAAWSRILRARRGDVEGTAPPDRNDEYLFYQLLIGTWPTEFLAGQPSDPEAMQRYSERIQAAMVKSVREAKVNSSWALPKRDYEEALLGFVREALDPARSAHFLAAFETLARRVARLGMRNSLVQTVLKLTVPGMPDIYQGTELWDLSLVDPDNRRPVDYALRGALLDQISADLARDRAGTIRRLLQEWESGAVKLAAIATLLDVRRQGPELFSQGSYEPLTVTGDKADQVCAFLRRHAGKSMIVAVARFPGRLEAAPGLEGCRLAVPEELAGATWRNVLNGVLVESEALHEIGNAFEDLPASVLISS